MNITMRGAVVLAAVSIPFLPSASSAWPFESGANPGTADVLSASSRAQGMVAAWPTRVRDLAEAMIQQYGAPDGVEPARLSWIGHTPWRSLSVSRDAPGASLEVSVGYEVPVRRWRALEDFGRGADYDPVKRELIARSDGEETDFLTLNLADEIVRGRRTPAQARDFYDRTYSLSLAGKSSRYMRRLLFRPRVTSARRE